MRFSRISGLLERALLSAAMSALLVVIDWQLKRVISRQEKEPGPSGGEAEGQKPGV